MMPNQPRYRQPVPTIAEGRSLTFIPFHLLVLYILLWRHGVPRRRSSEPGLRRYDGIPNRYGAGLLAGRWSRKEGRSYDWVDGVDSLGGGKPVAKVERTDRSRGLIAG